MTGHPIAPPKNGEIEKSLNLFLENVTSYHVNHKSQLPMFQLVKLLHKKL
jgi:hypothetical protein